MKVWMLDPAQLTPYYNIALCDALANAGCDINYVTSKYLYDDVLPFTHTFKTNYLYFPRLHHPIIKKYSNLRRLLRGVMYPIGHWQLLGQLHREKPDVLHIQWSRLPRFDKWLIQQVHKLGIPVVHTIHDIVPLYAPESSSEPLQQVYEKVDAVIVHTAANQRDFTKIYPRVAPQKVHLIPFINSPYQALPATANRELARQKLRIEINTPVFLFFGSIRHYKGLDTLIDAFKNVLKIRPDIHLIIAGLPETASDISLLKDAEDLPHCHIVSGYIPYEDMWQYYFAADVVVLPYRAITQSAALMTAMEFGRPLIVTNVGGLPETIDGNGWVIEKEDAKALATVMIEAVSNDERLQRMGKRSKELVHEKYSGAAVAEQTMKLYRSLMNR